MAVSSTQRQDETDERAGDAKRFEEDGCMHREGGKR